MLLFRIILILAVAALAAPWLYRLFKRGAARIRTELEDDPVVGSEAADKIADLHKHFNTRLQEERRDLEKRSRELKRLDKKLSK